MSFHHGIEHQWIESPGGKAIRISNASVVGLIATAKDADATVFPINKPTLVLNTAMISKAGTKGSLGKALEDIFRQTKATVIAVRVPEQNDAAKQAAEIIGKLSAENGEYSGIKALLNSESSIGLKPRILIAPEYTTLEGVRGALDAMAQKLNGIALCDGSDAGYESWINEVINLKNTYFIAGGVKVIDGQGKASVRPASATIAGHIARVDAKEGYSNSPSNRPLLEVLGSGIDIDHSITDKNARSNLLNSKNISCIVRDASGIKLWGNRLADGKLITHLRIRYMVGDAIVAYHQDFLDQKITPALIQTIQGRIKNFLRSLKIRGDIIDGDVWLDKEMNTESIKVGQLVWDYDLGLHGVAEHLIFRQQVTDKYNTQIFEGV